MLYRLSHITYLQCPRMASFRSLCLPGSLRKSDPNEILLTQGLLLLLTRGITMTWRALSWAGMLEKLPICIAGLGNPSTHQAAALGTQTHTHTHMCTYSCACVGLSLHFMKTVSERARFSESWFFSLKYCTNPSNSTYIVVIYFTLNYSIFQCIFITVYS